MNFIRKAASSLIITSIILSSIGSFPTTALAWSGSWSFAESCNASGTIDVTASYDSHDSLGGTVQYTSEHTNLDSGAVVTADLVEDNAQSASYTVTNSGDCHPATPSFCTEIGNGVLSFHEFLLARNAGAISVNLSVNEDKTLATFTVTNNTNCTAPISLSAYKVYDTTLSHQVFFDGAPEVQATSTTVITAKLPDCMAQIDAWYGQYPEQLLDADQYGYPNVPGVLAATFIYNSTGSYKDASGKFCTHEANNHPPVITLIGLNPATTTVGSIYNDAGATASDIEDGDITADIVATSTVNTAVAGAYTVTYNVSDSQGLAAEPVTRVVNVVPIEIPHDINHPPVLTLIGSNPATVNVGETYVDAGATAFDQEDGDITANIISTSTVNTAIAGSYTVTYNVSDSQGLPATPVSRTVNVLEVEHAQKGKITFCLMVADDQNVIATSSAGLPSGTFSLNLATSTDFSTSTFQTKVWNAESFAPNAKTILSSENDSDCVTYSDLPLGTYYYSTLGVTGSLWSTPKYSDQFNQPVNNIFDFYPYSPEFFTATTTDDANRNVNADGQIILNNDIKERTLIVLDTFSPAPQCTLPAITSALTASVTVGNPFTYALTGNASSTLAVATSTLPAGLSFATSTNTISGTPTEVGTYSITLTAQNSCGLDTETLALTVAAVTGGGGGGGSTNANLAVTKAADKATANVGDTVTYTITVVNNGPNDATGVTVTDSLPSQLTFVSATSTLGSFATSTNIWTIGNLTNASSTTLTLVATINAGTEGVKISNTATASGTQPDSDTSNNTSTADVTVNTPGGGGGGGGGGCSSNCGGGGGGGGGGGNGPIVGSYGGNGPIVPQVAGASTTNSCYYLYDYLRKDFNNNPVEVKKLQVFLKTLEGFSDLQVTGVYDDATIAATDAFQIRYKDDVLIPWGYTGTQGTDYVYITTKKKVNEIYCRTAFPVTPLQQAEIDAHRAFLQSLRDNGITLPEGGNGSSEQSPVILPGGNNTGSSQVGSKATSTNSDLSTLAGFSSTTQKMVSDLTANVISAGKKFINAITDFFKAPFAGFNSTLNQCVLGVGAWGWTSLALLIVILIMAILWYRQYQNNKKLDLINKEIDLQ